MSTVGERIKSIRQSLGLSMNEFGQLFNPPASKGVVSNWENDYNLPNNTRLKKIAKLCNVTTEQLLYGNPLSQYSTKELLEELLRREEVVH